MEPLLPTYQRGDHDKALFICSIYRILIRYRTLWVGHWTVAKKDSSASKPADPQSGEAHHNLSLMWAKPVTTAERPAFPKGLQLRQGHAAIRGSEMLKKHLKL